jgi:hypothetical protein
VTIPCQRWTERRDRHRPILRSQVNGASLAALLASCPPASSLDWARCARCAAPMRSDGSACTGLGGHPRLSTVQLYATWTGTRRNLGAMHAESIRLLVGPDQLDRRSLPPLAWALDNGAWGAFRRGASWAPDVFRRALDRWGEGADWIVLPDIVADGRASLDLSLSWLDEVAAAGRPVLLAVQDGMTAAVVRAHLGARVGIFVGGSTDWKWRTVSEWAALGREIGCHVHVGRVNSARRIRLCADLGVTSTDGTSPTLYADTSPALGLAARADAHPMLPLGLP